MKQENKDISKIKLDKISIGYSGKSIEYPEPQNPKQRPIGAKKAK